MARVRRPRRVEDEAAEGTAAAPVGTSAEAPSADPVTPWSALSRGTRGAVVALLVAFVLLAFASLVGDSPTVDECVYPVEGQYYLRTGDFSFNPQNPPLLKLLSAIPLVLHGARLDLDPRWHANLGGWEPWVLATRFALDNAASYHRLFIEARLVPLGLAVLLGLFVFRWSAALWGTHGGLLSLGLYVFCPNVLAHARLATPDLPVTCFMFLASYALWRAATRASAGDVLWLGLFVGLAFATKFSAVLLGPILAAQAWLLAKSPDEAGASPTWRLPWSPAVSFAVAAAVALAVVALAYNFTGLLRPWSTLPFASGPFRSLAGAVPWLRLPVPDAFLLGIDAKTADAGGSEFPGFLFGEWARGGFRAFYVASWLTKTPVAGLALLAWAGLAGYESDARARARLLLALVPVAAFLVLSTLLFSRVNYGLRYLLPMFPFVHLACGSLARFAVPGTRARAALAALAVLYAGETAAAHPGYLSFINPLGGGAGDGWKAFVDSNYDWGQDLRRLRQWMDATGTRRVHLAYFGHAPPEVYGIAYDPLRRDDRPTGVVAISASLLQGLPYPITYERPGSVRGVGANDYAWLRGLRPIGRAGMSILLFRVGGGP
jgi:hypothetical protein